MKVILVLVCILGGVVLADAQVASSTPSPDQATRRVIFPPRGSGGVFDAQRTANPQKNRSPNALNASRNPAYRKPTKEDWRLVAPDAETAAKYAEFLRRPKTGLVRLLSEAGCQENVNLVSAGEFCVKYQNVFGGSSYSFRTENYTLGRFSDVVYKDGAIYSFGRMTLGFLTDLGAGVSLADVSRQTAGAGYVFDFAPPENLPQIEASVSNFQKGVEAGGFSYRKSYPLRENHTYLLRSIAYRTRERTPEANKRIYDDLSADERRDVIVAFQVVRFADAEKSSVVLLWKELQRKDAAKISVDEK